MCLCVCMCMSVCVCVCMCVCVCVFESDVFFVGFLVFAFMCFVWCCAFDAVVAVLVEVCIVVKT